MHLTLTSSHSRVRILSSGVAHSSGLLVLPVYRLPDPQIRRQGLTLCDDEHYSDWSTMVGRFYQPRPLHFSFTMLPNPECQWNVSTDTEFNTPRLCFHLQRSSSKGPIPQQGLGDCVPHCLRFFVIYSNRQPCKVLASCLVIKT